MLKTFQGGVHPATLKTLTCDKPIKKAPVPKEAVIPLLQHAGAPAEPIVATGERVKIGQLIGRSDKFISSVVHASISGTVKKIGDYPHPVLGSCRAIAIESDGKDEPYFSSDESRKNIASNDEIIKAIKEAGIVGLGGAAFPAHVKLAPPKGKTIDSVILNGAECEPYLTCDHRLMLERSRDIIKGLEIIARLTDAKSIYIGIESNKARAASALSDVLKKIGSKRNIRTILLKTKYPQGAEKSLIKALLKREVPPGGLPFDVGCVVSNVGTAVAIYETVFYGKPLYERVVTISGDCVNDPANLLVRIGTPIKDLVEVCGGLKKDIYKIIFGGPMMGITQLTLDVPVIKGTSGVIFLSGDGFKESEEANCIRCAKCVDACPMNLVPTDIVRLVKKGDFRGAAAQNVEDCVECGACSYECPSKIPLLQWLKIGKEEAIKIKRSKA